MYVCVDADVFASDFEYLRAHEFDFTHVGIWKYVNANVYVYVYAYVFKIKQQETHARIEPCSHAICRWRMSRPVVSLAWTGDRVYLSKTVSSCGPPMPWVHSVPGDGKDAAGAGCWRSSDDIAATLRDAFPGHIHSFSFIFPLVNFLFYFIHAFH